MDNDQLSAMLGNVLSNPAIMAQLQGVLAGMGQNAPSPPPNGEENPPALEQAAPGAEASEGMAANAALMAQLPAMLGMLSSLPGGQGGQSGGHHPEGKGSNHRTALLLALKPYLNEGRCEMIDAIVNLSRLGDLLGKPGDR